jgi:hypothetical protein
MATVFPSGCIGHRLAFPIASHSPRLELSHCVHTTNEPTRLSRHLQAGTMFTKTLRGATDCLQSRHNPPSPRVGKPRRSVARAAAIAGDLRSRVSAGSESLPLPVLPGNWDMVRVRTDHIPLQETRAERQTAEQPNGGRGRLALSGCAVA